MDKEKPSQMFSNMLHSLRTALLSISDKPLNYAAKHDFDATSDGIDNF